MEGNETANILSGKETAIRRMASIACSTLLIEQALHMPSGHKIMGAEWDFGSRTVRLFLEGPDLPEVELGEVIPRINPIIHSSIDGEGKRVITWDWNIKQQEGL